jgi:eukaryotic-like serine/threonine-protein kinase
MLGSNHGKVLVWPTPLVHEDLCMGAAPMSVVQSSLICPYCSGINPSAARFCCQCGRALVAGATTSGVVASEAETADAAQAFAETRPNLADAADAALLEPPIEPAVAAPRTQPQTDSFSESAFITAPSASASKTKRWMIGAGAMLAALLVVFGLSKWMSEPTLPQDNAFTRAAAGAAAQNASSASAAADRVLSASPLAGSTPTAVAAISKKSQPEIIITETQEEAGKPYVSSASTPSLVITASSSAKSTGTTATLAATASNKSAQSTRTAALTANPPDAAASKARGIDKTSTATAPATTTPAAPSAGNPANTENAPSARPSPSPVTTAAASAGPSNPREACSDRVLLGFAYCMQEQCTSARFANHLQCSQMRELQQRSSQRNESNN